MIDRLLGFYKLLKLRQAQALARQAAPRCARVATWRASTCPPARLAYFAEYPRRPTVKRSTPMRCSKETTASKL